MVSPPRVTAARSLAAELGLDARFVEGNVFDAPALVGGETFDVEFTSRGVLGWLPRLEPWARAVAACLRPGGWRPVASACGASARACRWCTGSPRAARRDGCPADV
jgi:hypothetical protein